MHKTKKCRKLIMARLFKIILKMKCSNCNIYTLFELAYLKYSWKKYFFGRYSPEQVFK